VPERTKEAIVLEMARSVGVFRPIDLAPLGVSRSSLSSLVRRGLLERSGRGLYSLPDFEWTEHHTLAEACKRVPKGVVCLLSALRFHDIGTQNAPRVWLALDPAVTAPRVRYPRLRLVRFSGAALTTGIEEHQVEGVTIRVYSPAKTVADCFKYRHKIGLDVAIEALREYIGARKGTADELIRCARVCRVENVIRPYVQALTA
jgi:predicted transcriptional regulator of viral defense system